MKSLKYIKLIISVLLCAGICTTGVVCVEDVIAAQPASVQQTQSSHVADKQLNQFVNAAPLAVVNSPKSFLNKNIIMNAKFDKFSTLGLDYKPAFKSSDNYISFLIKRPDTNFDIPLSEMKLFLKRDMAEKYIDLKTNDEIEIKGIVFSDALGDAWIDVSELKVTKKAPEEVKE